MSVLSADKASFIEVYYDGGDNVVTELGPFEAATAAVATTGDGSGNRFDSGQSKGSNDSAEIEGNEDSGEREGDDDSKNIEDNDDLDSDNLRNEQLVHLTRCWPPPDDQHRFTAVTQFLSLHAAMTKFCCSPAKSLVTLLYPEEDMPILKCELCTHSNTYPRTTLLDGSHNCSKMMAKHIVKYHPDTMALPASEHLGATSDPVHEKVVDWLANLSRRLYQGLAVGDAILPLPAPVTHSPMGYAISPELSLRRAIHKANVVMGVLSNAEGALNNVVLSMVREQTLSEMMNGPLPCRFICGVCAAEGDNTAHCTPRSWFADLVRHYYRYHRDTLRVETALDVFGKAEKVHAERPARMQRMIDEGERYVSVVPLSEHLEGIVDQAAESGGWEPLEQFDEKQEEAGTNLFAQHICALFEFGDLLFYRHTATQQLGMRCLECAGESDDDTIQEVESIARGAIEHITSVHYRDLTVMGSWLSQSDGHMLQYRKPDAEYFVGEFCFEAECEAAAVVEMEHAVMEGDAHNILIHNSRIEERLRSEQELAEGEGQEQTPAEGVAAGSDEEPAEGSTVSSENADASNEGGSEEDVVSEDEEERMAQVLCSRMMVEEEQDQQVLDTVSDHPLTVEEMRKIVDYAEKHGTFETVQEVVPFYGPRGSGTFDQHAASMRNWSLSFHQLQRAVEVVAPILFNAEKGDVGSDASEP